MSGYNNLSVIECENEVLRSEYLKIRKAAKALVKAVDDYTTKAGPRPILITANENLKALLK